MASCFPGPGRINLSQHAQSVGGGGLFKGPTGFGNNGPRLAFLPLGSPIMESVSLPVARFVIPEIRNRTTYATGRNECSYSGAPGTAHAEHDEF